MRIFIQNLIQTIRSLRTQSWQVGISAISLAVGIVCFTLSSNWYWAESNYDFNRPDYKDLYILQQYTDSTSEWVYDYHVSTELIEMKERTAGVGYQMGFFGSMYRKEVSKENDEKQQKIEVAEMDTCTVDILGIKILHGSAKEALDVSRKNIIITDKAAMKIFGKTEVIGEVLFETLHTKTYTMIDGELTEIPVSYKNTYTIKAVCEAYEGRSTFKYDIIRPLSKSSYVKEAPYKATPYHCIVRTSDVERTVEQLNLYQRPDTEFKYKSLHPLRINPIIPATVRNNDMSKYFYVYLYHCSFTLVSLLLIISAVANLIMVTTSINLGRVREYALRRSMGATTWQNVQWMLTDILPTLLLGALLSGVGMEWVIKFADLPWDTSYVFHFYALVLAFTLLLCLIGMAYPVHKMRRAYRASFLGHGDGGKSHQWLIVVQCVVCAFLLFLALSMQRQIYTMLNADLGYDHDNMLRLHTGDKPKEYDQYYDFGNIFKDITQEIGKEAGAGVTDVLAMQSDLFREVFLAGILDEEEYSRHQSHPFQDDDLDWSYRSAFEIPFRATEFFNIRLKNGNKMQLHEENPNELQVYISSNQPPFSIDENYYIASRQNPRKITLKNSHLVGKRLNFRDVTTLRNPILFKVDFPAIYIGVEEFHQCANDFHDAIYIKYAEGRREDAEAAVRKVLAKFDVPEDQYMLNTYNEYIAAHYEKHMFIANLLTILTVISVVITLAGVFSMLLYSLRLRRRSMAIHRVMGATFKDIFIPTLRPYLIYAIIGAVVAYFPATLIINKWMTYFYYGEAPGVGQMLAIFTSMALIITLIVWWQVGLCMKEKPVEVLKPES